MEEYKILLENVNSNDTSEIIKNVLLVAGPIVGALLSFIVQNISMKRKEKRRQINRELEEFYYPMLELLRKNHILYNIFSNNQEIKTLVKLLNKQNFSNNDRALLCEIVKIDDEINKLILKNINLIKGDRELSDKINKASIHFTLIRMAYEGKIVGESERFEDYIFPRDLESDIEKIIANKK